MLRNIIGPIFNFRNCVFFVVFFGLFFFQKSSSFCRENEIFQKKNKNKKQTKMDQFLTLKRANLGPIFNFTAYIYVLFNVSETLYVMAVPPTAQTSGFPNVISWDAVDCMSIMECIETESPQKFLCNVFEGRAAHAKRDPCIKLQCPILVSCKFGGQPAAGILLIQILTSYLQAQGAKHSWTVTRHLSFSTSLPKIRRATPLLDIVVYG